MLKSLSIIRYIDYADDDAPPFLKNKCKLLKITKTINLIIWLMLFDNRWWELRNWIYNFDFMSMHQSFYESPSSFKLFCNRLIMMRQSSDWIMADFSVNPVKQGCTNPVTCIVTPLRHQSWRVADRYGSEEPLYKASIRTPICLFTCSLFQILCSILNICPLRWFPR